MNASQSRCERASTADANRNAQPDKHRAQIEAETRVRHALQYVGNVLPIEVHGGGIKHA